MAILEFNHWGSAIWGEASMCCSHLHLHIHHHNSQEIFWFRIVCTSQCMLQAAHALHLSCNKHVHFSMRVPNVNEEVSGCMHVHDDAGRKSRKTFFGRCPREVKPAVSFTAASACLSTLSTAASLIQSDLLPLAF